MHSESEVLLQGQSLPLNFEQSGLDFLSSNGKNWIKIFHRKIQQQHLFPHRMTVFMQAMFWVRTFDGICAILLLDWLSKNDVKATEPNLI